MTSQQPYEGFEIIEASRTDGWYYGAITLFGTSSCDCPPGGCVAGDGFVQAPDGSQAGLVWEVGVGENESLIPPDENRWGVFLVYFPRPVACEDDIAYCFRHVLPYLREQHILAASGQKV